MTNGIYGIRDNQADSYVGGVHIFTHDAAASRFFSDLASDPQTLISRHVADYQLDQLATFDLRSGMIDTAGFPKTILTGEMWAMINQPARPQNGQQLDMLRPATTPT